MRTITTHHDGFGLNESIRVEAVDEPGPGGANHRYEFTYRPDPDSQYGWGYTGYLQFQRGPRNEVGSTPGMTEGAVLAVLIDRLEAFQAGEFYCLENEAALVHLRDALAWTKIRTERRAERGVLGTYGK
jgi:hypothetical protein